MDDIQGLYQDAIFLNHDINKKDLNTKAMSVQQRVRIVMIQRDICSSKRRVLF